MIPEKAFQPVALKSRIILVEGPDDAGLVEAICSRQEISADVQISYYSREGTLGDFLDLLVRDAGFESVTRLGLTKDSDKTAANTIQSLRGSWERTKITLASLKRPEPQCLMFAVPNNVASGRIENLCLASPAFPPILVCAEQTYGCAVQQAPYEIDREKSIVNAYLAMMKKQGLRLGTGAQAGCWNLDSAAMKPLTEFVKAFR
jgi:hypothetical protein